MPYTDIEEIAVTTQYSMTPEHQATYTLNADGEATVIVRSKKPLKPRAVYVGESAMQSMWVHSTKSSHWTFMPGIAAPKQVQFTQAMDGEDQVTTVELGKIAATSGAVDVTGCGEIHASAVHFDLPYATDLWVFILKSPPAPFKVAAEKPMLNIAYTLAYTTAQVENTDNEETLRTYVNMHGEGFTNLILSIQRHTTYCKTEEILTEFKFGAAAVIWRPTIRNFDVALTTLSGIAHGDYIAFLESLGAETQSGVFGTLKSNFVLCDGPEIGYELVLKGEKKYFGLMEETKTAVKLSAASSQDS
jgi:hypothetical protein